MIEFLLALLICSNANECQWHRAGFYADESQCSQAAIYYTSLHHGVVRYKCTVVARY